MSLVQNIIKQFYNLRMRISKVTGIGMKVRTNDKDIEPPESFYNLSAQANNGQVVSFETFRDKKVLLVNLASKCGFTPQYKELEDLYRQNKNKLTVIGFPSDDFGGQEPGNDTEIAEFCRINYGVSFHLFHKDHVTGEEKQKVYQWLTTPELNGWNQEEPRWNFFKYLVNENGQLVKIFSSAVSPTGPEITNLL
ncbi:MAG: glutathione peroxidase [Ginsengibacter sp.]